MSLNKPASEDALPTTASGADAARIRLGPLFLLADPAFSPHLGKLLPDPERWMDVPPGASVIKSGKRRTVYSTLVDGFDGRVLVKVYRPAAVWDRLRDLFLRPQALQEFAVASALSRASIRVARPLAAGRARSFGLPGGSILVTRFVEGARTAMDLLKSGEDVSGLVPGLASCFAGLHSAGFFHPDLHLGNVLAARAGSSWEVMLIDLHSVPLGRGAGRNQFVENLAHARNSHVGGNPRQFAGFVAEYARQRGLPKAEGRVLAREAWERANLLLAGFYARRTARCLKDSSGFRRSRHKGAVVFSRTGVDVTDAIKAVESATAGLGTLMKDGEKTRVIAGLWMGNGKVVVKEYRGGGVRGALATLAGAGRARRAWVGGNGLLVRGIPAARPLILLERASGSSFVVMEDLSGSPELDRHLTRAEGSVPSALRNIASDLGRFVGRLHRKGVFHADLKTCNMLVLKGLDGRYDFALLDHDRISFGETVSARLRVRNLVQVNTSVPSAIPMTMRLRFLKAYVRACPFPGGMAALGAEVLSGSSGRRTVYVTDQGDVTEPERL